MVQELNACHWRTRRKGETQRSKGNIEKATAKNIPKLVKTTDSRSAPNPKEKTKQTKNLGNHNQAIENRRQRENKRNTTSKEAAIRLTVE